MGQRLTLAEVGVVDAAAAQVIYDLRRENARLRALTVDDPTSIYHEHEQFRLALEAIALGRCEGHLHHPVGSAPCPYRTPPSYARAVLAGK